MDWVYLKRMCLTKEGARDAAAECGLPAPEKRPVGAPLGHVVHTKSFKPTAVIDIDDITHCPEHKMDLEQGKLISKCIMDFEIPTTCIVCKRYRGHRMKCPKGCIIEPKFPSIPGTSLGRVMLRYIITLATRRAVDSDISYYMVDLFHLEMATNTIWNARVAISGMLALSIEYIVEELRKADFIQMDETHYKYKKKKIYVWVIRTDRVTLILPLTGRGNDDILPHLEGLRDKPIVADGYSVYKVQPQVHLHNVRSK